MNTQNIIEIAIPAIAVIYYTGIQSQILKQLKKITADHEERLRKGGL